MLVLTELEGQRVCGFDRIKLVWVLGCDAALLAPAVLVSPKQEVRHESGRFCAQRRR